MKRKRENSSALTNFKKDFLEGKNQEPLCKEYECEFYANKPSFFCSDHKRDLVGQLKGLPLSLSLLSIPEFHVDQVAGLCRFLLETEDGKEAKKVMDLNYETKFEYIRLAPGINVIPRIPAIKNFTIRLFEMSEIQLLTFEDLKQLAIVLAKTCQEWYPKGIPFVLWAQLIAYSHVPVLSPPHDYSLGLNNIVYDSTQ